MLKVFLVEDEFIVREGIKKNIDWKAHGYDFCGEAADGELAFPMIQKLKPDIVITDIRMPFMDGLELSRLIRQELPWTEILVLTGHAEFEYAQEGIKIGISQYLMKPISGEELLREVDAVAEKIREKQEERAIHETFRKEMEERFQIERSELFRDLVTGGKSVSELIRGAAKLEIDLTAPWYNIILLAVQSKRHAQDEYSGSAAEAEARIREMADSRHIVMFDRSLEGKAMLLKADSEEELMRRQEEVIRDTEEILKGFAHVRYFGGTGRPVNRLRELPVCFETASRAFAGRYLAAESRILDGTQEWKTPFAEEQEFHIETVNPERFDREKIREFLRFGEEDEIAYFTEAFFRQMGEGAMRSRFFRQYITMDAYFCVVEFLGSMELSRGEIEPLDVRSDTLESEENAIRYIRGILRQALALRDQKADNRYRDVVAEAIRYIEENYANEDLSLNELASHVNFSPNHLSTIFSRQTGQPFIRWLTDYRMNRAKELLRCTGKKNSVIALEVGYKDPHYFSYLFKKTQGLTPTQYRNGKKTEGK